MSDTSENSATLQAYEDNLQAYINGTPREVSGAFKAWIDKALSLISKNDPILEVGSGLGRDADYIEAKGYTVQRTDAAASFVRHLRAAGHEVRTLNVLTDPLGGPYGLILANAVLLHFKPAQTKAVLLKMHTALKPGGILALALKKGQGEAWKTDKLGAPRYFHYWTAQPLKTLLVATGYDVLALDPHTSGHSGSEWLYVIVRKRTPA